MPTRARPRRLSSREAEQLATSTDWAPTARAFKQLMDRWRAAGRASRAEDDALWERFRSAQDAFFAAKDRVAAAEDEEFRSNLVVKEELLTEAEALLPVTDVEAAKGALRGIQDRWERAGKVPRAELERVEKRMRRVETAVREADEQRWRRSNPEVAARARSLVDQLEASVAVHRGRGRAGRGERATSRPPRRRASGSAPSRSGSPRPAPASTSSAADHHGSVVGCARVSRRCAGLR